jgi:hypothetical protein
VAALKSCKVLLLGPSTVTFSDTPSGPTLPSLLEAALRESEPDVAWRCAAEILYITPSMAKRARSLVEAQEPDLVVLRASGTAFLSDLAIYALRNRWPRSYRVAVRASAWLARIAGADRDGGSGPRSWVFRLPRAVAEAVAGRAPSVQPDEAAAIVQETLDALTAEESRQVLVYMASLNTNRGLPPVEHDRRVAIYRAAVTRHCLDRRIPLFDPEVELGGDAPIYNYHEDQWHPLREYLEAESRLMAHEVLKAIGVAAARA